MKEQSSLGQHQRGSVIVFAALGLSLMVILLAISDIGFLYFYKREYQKAADLAALAGASSLVDVMTGSRNCGTNATPENPNGGTGARGAAWISASQNLGSKTYTPIVECGIWKPSAVPPASRFTVTADTSLMDAVRVEISGKPPRFLPFIPSVTISAHAVASTGAPRAAFSVGTRLAALGGSSVVGNLLKAVGIDTGLDLLSYNGLAGVTIKPRGLLEALGIPVSVDLSVADFNALLAAEQVSLGQILDATATVVGQNDLLGLNAQLLGALKVPLQVSELDDIVVNLGSSAGGNGLFAAITSPVGSALDVDVDALGLISAAIGVATSGRAIDVSLSGLNGLSSLTGATLTAKVGVIEPPSIGIGGVGATAYSAQTRVFAQVTFNSTQLLAGAGGLLSTLLGTSVNIDLPIVIDLAAAKGTVTSLCTPALKALNNPPACPGGQDCADIAVDASIAKICVGNINPGTVFSTKSSCDVGLTNKQLLNVNLLGSGLIGLNTHLSVDALATAGSVTLAKQQEGTVNGNLSLGTTVKNLTDALLAGLLGTGINQKPTLDDAQRTTLATKLWEQVGGNSCASGFSGSGCRDQNFHEAVDFLNDASTGLVGFLTSALLNPVVGLLSSVLTLNLVGVLQSVGGLVGGLLGVVGGLVGGLLDVVAGNPCTGGGLIPIYGGGSSAGCIGQLKPVVQATSGSSPQAGVVALLGLVMELLRPILDTIGNNLLMPLLQNLLGLQVGQTDVTLMGLECRAGAVLVD